MLLRFACLVPCLCMDGCCYLSSSGPKNAFPTSFAIVNELKTEWVVEMSLVGCGVDNMDYEE